MKRDKGRYGVVIGVRLPPELDEAIRYAAMQSNKSVSDIMRGALARAWGLTPEPQEVHPQ